MCSKGRKWGFCKMDRMKVLIVDDNEDLVALTKTALENLLSENVG
jgi:CheY-like chemotaxis protein